MNIMASNINAEKVDGDVEVEVMEPQSVEGEVILDGEEIPREEPKTQAEMLRDQYMDAKEGAIDQAIEDNGVEFNEDAESASMSIEQIQKNFDDIMSQSGESSSEISSRIQLMDLSEESQDMVTDTLMEIEEVCNRKSLGDKVIGLLPSSIGSKVKKMKDEGKKELIKQKTVAEIATRHFNALEDKKDILVDNLESMYQIRDKLTQSSDLLLGMTTEIDRNLTQLNGNTDADSRKNILKGKELMVQVQSQVTSQKGLIDQIDTVDFVAQAVVDNINQALPAIKSNFIDQVSITAGLNNLRDLKESVDKTREMTITMSEQTFKESREVLTNIMEDGVGLREKDIDRLEKLEKEKAAFRGVVSDKLVQKSTQLDERIQKLNKVMNNQQSTLSNDSLAQVEYKGVESEQDKRRSRRNR